MTDFGIPSSHGITALIIEPSLGQGLLLYSFMSDISAVYLELNMLVLEFAGVVKTKQSLYNVQHFKLLKEK